MNMRNAKEGNTSVVCVRAGVVAFFLVFAPENRVLKARWGGGESSFPMGENLVLGGPREGDWGQTSSGIAPRPAPQRAGAAAWEVTAAREKVGDWVNTSHFGNMLGLK